MERVDVHEGERAFVLVDLEARGLAGDDLAEDAVGVPLHRRLPEGRVRPSSGAL